MDQEGSNSRAIGVSPQEQAQIVARSLAEAARRARFSTRGRRALASGGFHARRGERLWRIIFFASFTLMAAIPSLSTAVYFGLIASNQFVTEARFTLRGGMPPKSDSLGTLTGMPSLQIVQDTLILVDYIRSRPLLERLDKTLDLQAIFSRPGVDFWSRLDPEEPIEKFLKYWNSMVNVSIQMPAGIIVMNVRAFSAADSAKIASAILEASEELVNTMNDRMLKDAVGLSLEEQKRAGEKLMQARIALETARNDEGMLNAERTGDAITGLVAKVEGEELKLQQQYDSQKKFVLEDAPQMRALKERINAANEQIALLKAKLTRGEEGGDAKVLTSTMSKMNYLELEHEIAEKIYASSTAAVESARLASESKLMYLNTFVKPVEAQESRYPRRLADIGLVSALSLAIWGLTWGLAVLARNHMA